MRKAWEFPAPGCRDVCMEGAKLCIVIAGFHIGSQTQKVIVHPLLPLSPAVFEDDGLQQTELESLKRIAHEEFESGKILAPIRLIMCPLSIYVFFQFLEKSPHFSLIIVPTSVQVLDSLNIARDLAGRVWGWEQGMNGLYRQLWRMFQIDPRCLDAKRIRQLLIVCVEHLKHLFLIVWAYWDVV